MSTIIRGLVLSFLYLSFSFSMHDHTILAMYDAVDRGSIVEIEMILDHGYSVETFTDKVTKETLLHCASARSTSGIVQHLIEKGCLVSAIDRNGQLPIHRAAKNPNPYPIFGLLLDAGSPIDDRDRTQRKAPPLINYILNQVNPDIRVLHLLTRHGVNFSVRDGYGKSPLTYYANNDDTDSVSHILTRGMYVPSLASDVVERRKKNLMFFLFVCKHGDYLKNLPEPLQMNIALFTYGMVSSQSVFDKFSSVNLEAMHTKESLQVVPTQWCIDFCVKNPQKKILQDFIASVLLERANKLIASEQFADNNYTGGSEIMKQLINPNDDAARQVIIDGYIYGQVEKQEEESDNSLEPPAKKRKISKN